jgi:hypothetical protein
MVSFLLVVDEWIGGDRTLQPMIAARPCATLVNPAPSNLPFNVQRCHVQPPPDVQRSTLPRSTPSRRSTFNAATFNPLPTFNVQRCHVQPPPDVQRSTLPRSTPSRRSTFNATTFNPLPTFNVQRDHLQPPPAMHHPAPEAPPGLHGIRGTDSPTCRARSLRTDAQPSPATPRD